LQDTRSRARLAWLRSDRDGCHRQFDEFAALHRNSPGECRRAWRPFALRMMVGTPGGVEGRAKIATTRLRSISATVDLLLQCK